jgi:hypothetical protein
MRRTLTIKLPKKRDDQNTNNVCVKAEKLNLFLHCRKQVFKDEEEKLRHTSTLFGN